MANLNKVLLMGRLTRDPEQRFIPSGQSVVGIGLAVNRTYTVNGEKREETTYVDVEAWGQRGMNSNMDAVATTVLMMLIEATRR